MNRPLRVLHVAETAKGGVGSYVDDVVSEQLARHGADSVRVILPRAHADQLRRVPAQVQRPYAAGRLRSLGVLALAWATLKAVWQWRPHVVHLHSTVAGLVLRPLLWALPGRPRIVYCAHGWAFHREGGATGNRRLERLERGLSACCDVVVCISEHDRRAGLEIGIAPAKLELVYNGIADTPAPTAEALRAAQALWPAAPLRVLFVGRLDRQKGVDILFEAIAPLAGLLHALVVGQPVVGDAPPASVPANARVLGWVDRENLPPLYAAADLVVVPSRWEGLGLVALEAMRAGTPVLATAVGGLLEVVQDGTTGRLVPGGGADAWASVLARIGSDDLHAMGAAGRRLFVERFRIDATVDRLEAIYRRASEARTRPRSRLSEG